jgi:hypothetical protein
LQGTFVFGFVRNHFELIKDTWIAPRVPFNEELWQWLSDLYIFRYVFCVAEVYRQQIVPVAVHISNKEDVMEPMSDFEVEFYQDKAHQEYLEKTPKWEQLWDGAVDYVDRHLFLCLELA